MLDVGAVKYLIKVAISTKNPTAPPFENFKQYSLLNAFNELLHLLTSFRIA